MPGEACNRRATQMKRTEAAFYVHACAVLAAMGLASVGLAGCLQIIGLENRKDPVSPGDGAEDTLLDAEMHEDILDVPPDDATDTVDAPEDADGFDADDRLDDEDTVPDPDGPDSPELPPGLVWVPIPAGSFWMGCSPEDGLCEADEFPYHPVTVSAFEMTETEITQDQYESVTGVNPSSVVCADCPVVQVSWQDAKAFCEAIGGRLPSEAEWEYAARAGSTSRYTCGDDLACLDGMAWYLDNSGGVMHPVHGKAANAFDLYDMLGNVWEWNEDCYHDDYTGAPSTAEVWSGGDCSKLMLRGSYWSGNDDFIRVSNRSYDVTGSVSARYGIRCCK